MSEKLFFFNFILHICGELVISNLYICIRLTLECHPLLCVCMYEQRDRERERERGGERRGGEGY